MSLALGAYGSVEIQPNGLLELSAGEYTMSSFRAQSSSTLRLDSSAGPILLYVRDVLEWRGALEGASAQELFAGFLGFLGAGTADISGRLLERAAGLRAGRARGLPGMRTVVPRIRADGVYGFGLQIATLVSF